MSKLNVLIVLLCAMLWTSGVYAQPLQLSLEELFELADKNSKAILAQSVALDKAEQAVKEARSARLPDIELSLSASYLGNGHLTDRDFANGMSVDIPHFGNNFAIEAVQLIYGGGVVSNGIALAKLQLKRLELAHKRVLNTVEILNYDLVTMLALPAETIIEPTEGLLEKTLHTDTEEHWQQLSTSNAHALKLSSLAVEMSEKQLSLARAERLPKVGH